MPTGSECGLRYRTDDDHGSNQSTTFLEVIRNDGEKKEPESRGENTIYNKSLFIGNGYSNADKGEEGKGRSVG